MSDIDDLSHVLVRERNGLMAAAKRVEELERQLAQLDEAPAWQPIATLTSPKTADWVLLRQADCVMEKAGMPRIAACHYTATSGFWKDADKQLFFHPTHWMRIPVLP